jgi:hypothetical protein
MSVSFLLLDKLTFFSYICVSSSTLLEKHTVCNNAQRYIKMFERIADELLTNIDPTKRFEEDVRDVLEKQRASQIQATANPVRQETQNPKNCT